MDIEEYNKGTYEALAGKYESNVEKKRKLSKPIIKRLSQYIKTGKEFLDVGCAVGIHMKIFNELGFNVTGIDISKKMTKFAKKRNPNSKIYLGDFMKTKFNKKFDAIYAQGFIHLYPKSKVERVLGKIKSLLKEGGVLFVTTSKSDVSKEGLYTKTNYSQKLKRFRKFWTKEELYSTLSKKFKMVDYFEKKNIFGDVWMIFVVQK